MRPLRLEMTAFGSYKDKTVVDFEKLGNGIYAITGPTGAGKTTIFDAIMFALYEEVSAKGVDSKSNPVDADSVRSKKMIRSRFADMKTDTIVKLTFEERGKCYTVVRKMHVTPSTINNPKVTSAELTGEGISIEKSGNVTAEITRILGDIDSTRFRQIVMLAQGQFKAFMEAKDEQRKDILSALFDGTPYHIFQLRLKNAAAKLQEEKKESDLKVRVKFAPDVFLLPEDATEEERALYSPDLPTKDLEANLNALIEKDEEAEADLADQDKVLNEQKGELNRRMGAAKEANQRYQEMKDLEEHLAELEARKETMAKRQSDYEETAAALHLVKPKDDNCKTREKDLTVTWKDLTDTAVALDEAMARKKIAAEAMEGNDQREKLSLEKNRQADRCSEHLKEFVELAKAKDSFAENESTLKKLEISLNKAESAIKDKEAEKENIKGELSKLGDALTDEVKVKQGYDEALKAVDRLMNPKNGLQGRFASLLKEEKALGKLLEKAKAAALDEEKADRDYRDIHQRYLDGYAGVLGVELKRAIEEEGEARCPVCGSHFTKESGLIEDAVSDALTGEMISQDDLDAAEAARNKAAKASKDATDRFNTAKTSFETTRDALLVDLSSEIEDGKPWVWDTSAIEQRLEEAASKRHSEEAKLAEEVAKAGEKVRRKEELEAASKKNQEDLEALENKQRGDKEKQINAAADQKRYDADIKRLETALKESGMDVYASKTEAEEAIRKLREEVQVLKDEIDSSSKAYAKAEKEVAGLDELHKEKTKQSDRQGEELKKAYIAFEEAWKEAGFASEKTYIDAIYRVVREDEQAADAFEREEALQNISLEEGEDWLSVQRDALNGFANDLSNTGERLANIRKKAPVYTDLQVLQEEEAALEEKLKTLTGERKTLGRYADSHRQALNTLRTVSDELSVISAAYARLNNLASVANGESSIGGKRTFEGYVLGSTFREVLDHASYYLDEMTGGKYELCHDTEGVGVGKSTQANFRIMVQDSLSGQEREIGSLSGGEAFQVAMALALGLSDTVQSHVSTVSIDTMFIDEGFGSLDKDSLHRMLQVLNKLSGGQRQIGIISHVDELKECVGKFIHVTGSKDKQGSRLKVEV